jgi:hypothetical protein
LRFDVARDHLILGMSALALSILPALLLSEHRIPKESKGGDDRPIPLPSLTGMFSLWRSDARFRWLVGVHLSMGFVYASCTYLFFWLITFGTEGGGPRTTFFSYLCIGISGASLAMQLFGSGRILRRIGPTAALLTIPVILLAGSAYLLFQAVVWVMIGMQLLYDALEDALIDPARERLFAQVGRDRIDEVRILCRQGARLSGGAAAGGILLLLSFVIDASFRSTLGVFMLSTLILGYSIIGLRRQLTMD